MKTESFGQKDKINSFKMGRNQASDLSFSQQQGPNNYKIWYTGKECVSPVLLQPTKLSFKSKHKYIFLIHSSVDQHLGSFHVLAIVKSAAINILMHIYFWIIFLSKYMPRSGIAVSCGNFMFSFQSHLRTFFHSGCTYLHSQQHCRRVPLSPHPHQH